METCTPGGTWGGSDKSVTVPTRVCEGTLWWLERSASLRGGSPLGVLPVRRAGVYIRANPRVPLRRGHPQISYLTGRFPQVEGATHAPTAGVVFCCTPGASAPGYAATEYLKPLCFRAG